MKTGLRITGSELESFYKNNPTAVFWVSTGWGDRKLVKNDTYWYYDCLYFEQHMTKSDIESLPEIKVFIP